MAKAASKVALERLMTVRDLAEVCQVEVETVYKWRLRGYGPKGLRVGKFLRYDPEVVRKWLQDQSDVATAA